VSAVTLPRTEPAPLDRLFRVGLSVAGLIGIILGVLVGLKDQLFTGQLRDLATVGGFVVGLLASGLVWDLMSRAQRKPALTFVVSPAGFAAPAEPFAYRGAVGLGFVWPMALAYGVVRLVEGDNVLHQRASTWISSAALLVLSAAAALAVRRPVVLAPAGLRVRRRLRYTTVSWDTITAIEFRSATRSVAELAGGGRVPLPPTHVRSDLLGYAIGWYATHPKDRPAVGTEAEHNRLVAAFLARPSR
jgi:hypothetical protein